MPRLLIETKEFEILITECDCDVIADFNYNISDKTVTLTNNSSGGNGTFYYFWNFGDKGSSNLENPSFTFDESGTYTICLI